MWNERLCLLMSFYSVDIIEVNVMKYTFEYYWYKNKNLYIFWNKIYIFKSLTVTYIG